MTLAPRSRWRHAWLPCAWALGVFLVAYGSTRGPFDPTSHQYGANWPGDVRRAVVQVTCEVLALYIILRPHSYAASWKRCAISFLLFLPWTLLNGLSTMHSGRIDNYHWLWMLLLSLALLGTVFISSSLAIRYRATAT